MLQETGRTLHNDQGIHPRRRYNIYAPNIGAPQYIRQLLTAIKEEINSNTIIVGILAPHLHQWINHPDRKLIRKHKL